MKVNTDSFFPTRLSNIDEFFQGRLIGGSRTMKNELAFKSCDNCMQVARILVEENQVVMISKEENLWILNFEYSHNSDRNDVVFMSKEEFYEQLEERNDE